MYEIDHTRLPRLAYRLLMFGYFGTAVPYEPFRTIAIVVFIATCAGMIADAIARWWDDDSNPGPNGGRRVIITSKNILREENDLRKAA